MNYEFCYHVTLYSMRKRCPWAAVIARVEGGFVAFESRDDYRTWRAQK